MGSDDVDVMRAGYDALMRGDFAASIAQLSEDVELHTVAEGVYRGHTGIRRWLRDMSAAFEPWRVELLGVRGGSAGVLVSTRLTGVSRAGGVPVDQLFWIVWTVADGKGLRGVHYTDEAAALAASGVRA